MIVCIYYCVTSKVTIDKRINGLIVYNVLLSNQNQIKSSLYSSYYAEGRNELRGPSPRLSAWATHLRRNVATVASRWRRCAELTGPGIEPQTSRTDSVRLAADLHNLETRA